MLPGWLQSIIKYFSSSIGKKIIIPYAILTMVLAAVGIFVIMQLVATRFETALQSRLLEAGRVVSDEVVNRERLRLEIERVVANTEDVPKAIINRDTKTLEEAISPIIANAEVIDSIIIVDTQGKDILSFKRGTSPDSPVLNQLGSGLDFSNWPSVSRILANPEGNKETELARDTTTNELIIYTVGPIRTAEDGLVGVALVGTFLNKEANALRELIVPAHLTLFNENGQVVYTTFALNRSQQTESFQVFTPERFQQVLDTKEETLMDQIEIPGARSFRLAYAPFILRGRVFGVYAVALETNFITETTQQSRDWLIALFSIGVVVVFGIGYLVSQRISQPIMGLVRTTKAIAAGDLSQRSGIEREDEIGTLATQFDRMTAELQRLLQVQKEEASKLNAILNSIADGVIVQDLNGNILIQNPAAEKILQDIGQDVVLITSQKMESEEPKQSQKEEEFTTLLNYLTGLEFRETQQIEVNRTVLSALAAPVITSDNIRLGSVVVLRDITAEVESQKLKDDFITSVSHELKTPITAIINDGQLLRMVLEMKPADQVDPQLLRIVERLGKEARDLDNLIQAMIDVSQIDAGQLGIDWERLDLSELIEAEITNWTDKMAERELSLTTHLSSEPVWIEGDENKLTKALRNLIKNAHDYTLPGGNVEISLKRANGQARVDIKDTGVGVVEEKQRFLFTRFYRAIHEESTFEQSGAGLGLYISKAIVEAHNGEIWMEESAVDKGSTEQNGKFDE